jgi:alkylation response protein AidB-like acyl-CoA dehydrogenase
MDVSFSDEERWFQQSIRSFLEKELAPNIDAYEEREEFPREILPKLGAQGFLGVGFPDDVGGSGLGHVGVAILSEEIARIAGGVASSVLTHMIAARVITEVGTPTQRARYAAPAIRGDILCGIAVTEPNHGSNVAGIETVATEERGGYRLDGAKMFITNARLCNVMVVAAKTDRSRGRKGISLFLVARDNPGYQPGAKLKKLGWHTSDTAPVTLDNCWVPKDHLLGHEHEGFYHVMKGFAYERIIMAGMGVGQAQAAYEDALEYAKVRVQFDRRISEYQAIRHKLVDMYASITAARQVMFWAASRADRGEPTPEDAALAKLYASEVATRVAGDAVQIHGGYGFMREYRVSRIYRDVKVLTIGGGTSEIQREIIAKSLAL